MIEKRRVISPFFSQKSKYIIITQYYDRKWRKTYKKASSPID